MKATVYMNFYVVLCWFEEAKMNLEMCFKYLGKNYYSITNNCVVSGKETSCEYDNRESFEFMTLLEFKRSCSNYFKL